MFSYFINDSIYNFQDVPSSKLPESTLYDCLELRHESSTLPRRHRRHMSSDSTFLISSRDCSPVRRRSPAYCSGSLPRSTNSIQAINHQSKEQRSLPSKQLVNEQNQMTTTNDNVRRNAKKTYMLENGISNDRNYRFVNSGPSSYESGNASIVSVVSSIEDEKTYNKICGHSKVDSNLSMSTIVTSKTGNRSLYTNRNISPKCSPKHHLTKSKLSMDSNSRSKKFPTSTSNVSVRTEDTKPSEHIFGKPPIGIPNSNSNNSITLQVTTSNESSIPNTKIFVQNSPVRSVITLENGQLLENSNVYIINNETTSTGNGDVIKKSISKQSLLAKTRASSKLDTENELLFSENDLSSEICDSISIISGISPESSDFLTPTPEPFTLDSIECTKNVKNVNNDATMNNGRKFSLPISNTNIIYKNVLKNVNDTGPVAALNNKNVFTLDEIMTEKMETLNLERNTIAGSAGNLRFFEKNEKIINSNCELKLPSYEPNCGHMAKLNSNPAIHKESIAQILSKNMAAVGSEPNLALNSNSECKQKMNLIDKSVEKRDELYNFPSLSDLNFNFTSLAAQKILKGVSINSIDTLVELNMAQDKHQNNVSAANTASQAVCTDYGMI